MKKFHLYIASVVFLVFSLCICFISGSPREAFAQEKSWEITSFVSMIEIERDGTMHVEDEVTFRFTGEYSYVTREIVKRRLNRIENVTVFDGSGVELSDSSAQVSETSDAVNVRLNFKKKNEEATWTFRYDVVGAIGYYDGYDELYWNVTGHQTPVAIHEVIARVRLPSAVPNAEVRLKDFTGLEASNIARASRAYDETERTATFTVHGLDPYEGLTALIGFPKGVVTEPAVVHVTSNPGGADVFVDGLRHETVTPTDVLLQPGTHTIQLKKSGYHPVDAHTLTFREGQTVDLHDDLRETLWSRVLTVAIVASLFGIPLLALIINGLRWRKHGKDIKLKKTIIAQYDPPDNLSPVHVAYLMENAFKPRHLAASIVGIAEAGYLTIKEVDAKTFAFTRTKRVPKSESYEEKFLWQFFDGRETISTKQLKNAFYTRIPALKERVVSDMISGGYYGRDPQKAKIGPIIVGSLLVVLGLFTAVFVIGVAILFAGVITIIFGALMAKRTRKGAEALWHAEGLREYLQVAERFRMADVKPEEFTKLLPYAMVMGVADQWAERFHDVTITPPNWYEGHDPNFAHSFSPALFAASLSTMHSSVGGAMVSRPGGSASGGSGFSGGGGSSGGGGGGGGFSAG